MNNHDHDDENTEIPPEQRPYSPGDVENAVLYFASNRPLANQIHRRMDVLMSKINSTRGITRRSNQETLDQLVKDNKEMFRHGVIIYWDREEGTPDLWLLKPDHISREEWIGRIWKFTDEEKPAELDSTQINIINLTPEQIMDLIRKGKLPPPPGGIDPE